MPVPSLALSTRIRRNPEALHRRVGEETVLLDLLNGCYFGLDIVGTRVWELLGQEPQLSAVLEALVAEFEVDPATAQNDLFRLVADLAEAQLVSLADAAG